MIDNFLPIPDAEYLPLDRKVLKLACVCGQDGRTVLITSAAGGHVEVARLLLEKGADIHAAVQVQGWGGQAGWAYLNLSSFSVFHNLLVLEIFPFNYHVSDSRENIIDFDGVDGCII